MLCEECKRANKDDQRTPGLFKTEYTGTGFVGLCSKTYYCKGHEGSKISCKGLNKHRNVFDKQKFLDVIYNRESDGGTNVNFRVKDGNVYTYSQTRKSLSFLYIKRLVRADGITTDPTEA